MKGEHFKEMLEPPSSVQQGIEKLIEHLRYKSPSLWHQGKTRTESGVVLSARPPSQSGVLCSLDFSQRAPGLVTCPLWGSLPLSKSSLDFKNIPRHTLGGKA